jgi:uncharacterized protein
MRDVLQAFTMFVGGFDIGLETETVTLPIPKPIRQTYNGGTMHMGYNAKMAKFEPVTCSVKLAGYSEIIQKLVARGPGQLDDITFRMAVQKKATLNQYSSHIVQMRAAIDIEALDEASRGEKSGMDFMLDSIEYYRYDIGDTTVREFQIDPSIWKINGVDQLANLNRALGY